MFFGLLAAIVAHKMDPRVYVASDVEGVLGFPPMAQLPDFTEVSGEAAEEHLLRLAAAIEHARKQGHLRNCIFTGTAAGTGVTTLATRVRVLLEAMGRPTVFVDACGTSSLDLGEGSGAPAPPGSQALVATRGSRSSALLQQMAEEADEETLVLTDTAPLAVSAETEYLARFADCAIVVIESGVTSRTEIRNVATRLQHLNVSAVGFVLNRVGHAKADPAFRASVLAVEKHLQNQKNSTAMRMPHNAPVPSHAPIQSAAAPVPREPRPDLRPDPRPEARPDSRPAPLAQANPEPRPVAAAPRAFTSGFEPVSRNDVAPVLQTAVHVEPLVRMEPIAAMENVSPSVPAALSVPPTSAVPTSAVPVPRIGEPQQFEPPVNLQPLPGIETLSAPALSSEPVPVPEPEPVPAPVPEPVPLPQPVPEPEPIVVAAPEALTIPVLSQIAATPPLAPPQLELASPETIAYSEPAIPVEPESSLQPAAQQETVPAVAAVAPEPGTPAPMWFHLERIPDAAEAVQAASGQPGQPPTKQEPVVTPEPELDASTPWWLSDVPMQHVEPQAPVLWPPAKGSGAPASAGYLSADPAALSRHAEPIAAQRRKQPPPKSPEQAQSPSNGKPAEPVGNRPNPQEPQESPARLTSRLSGLRNLFSGLGLRDSHAAADAARHEDHPAPVPVRGADHSTLLRDAAVDRAAIPGNGSSAVEEQPRQVIARPEVLPPSADSDPREPIFEKPSNSTFRNGRESAKDAVQILPAKRGQYRNL